MRVVNQDILPLPDRIRIDIQFIIRPVDTDHRRGIVCIEVDIIEIQIVSIMADISERDNHLTISCKR